MNRKIILPAVFLLTLSFMNTVAQAGPLKPVMKEMRLHYKAAIETTDPEVFNQHKAGFLEQLEKAKAFNFSPERKELSLQGLNKVEELVRNLPEVNETNLSKVQLDMIRVDHLRKEYHDKVKPGPWELLWNTIINSFKD